MILEHWLLYGRGTLVLDPLCALHWLLLLLLLHLLIGGFLSLQLSQVSAQALLNLVPDILPVGEAVD